MDAETIAKADAAFIKARPRVDVSFEDVANTCAKAIAKASEAEAITDEERDIVRRAHAVLKGTDADAEDAELASVDEELWALVKADVEGIEANVAAPSAAVLQLAKAWNAAPEAAPPKVPEVAPAPVADHSAEVAAILMSQDLNASHPVNPPA